MLQCRRALGQRPIALRKREKLIAQELVLDLGSFTLAMRGEFKKVFCLLHAAPVFIADAGNTSLNVTAHVLVWPVYKTMVPRRLTIENGRRCRRINGSHRAAGRSTNGDDPSIGGGAKAIGWDVSGEAIRGSQPRASAFCSYVVVRPADCLRSSCRFWDRL
jgi:hypothetical protein